MWARETVRNYARTSSDMATLLNRVHIIVARSWVPAQCMVGLNVDPPARWVK
jgi:hypothetical protein